MRAGTLSTASRAAGSNRERMSQAWMAILAERQGGIGPERHEPQGTVGRFLPVLRAKLCE